MRTADGRYAQSAEAALLDHNFFRSGSLRADWLAGLIAADGHIKSASAWNLSQSGAHGRDLIEIVRSLVGHQLTVSRCQPTKGSEAFSIYVPSPQMVSDLADIYGVHPRKSLTAWPHRGPG